jgi:hypothetical protein
LKKPDSKKSISDVLSKIKEMGNGDKDQVGVGVGGKERDRTAGQGTEDKHGGDTTEEEESHMELKKL